LLQLLLLLYSSLLLQVSGSQGTLNLWETNRGTDTTEMTLLVRVNLLAAALLADASTCRPAATTQLFFA
jgi:hypothetical protein